MEDLYQIFRREQVSVEQALKPSLEEVKVRERLLSAAAELFARKGYAATSVNEIVMAAGVTKPILYYYFKNKEGIYLEILNDGFGKYAELVAEAKEWKGSAFDRVRHLVGNLFQIFVEKLDTARLFHSIYYGPPQGAPFYDFDAHHLEFLKVLHDIVEEGIRDGEFAPGDPERISLGLAGVGNLAMDLELWGKGPRLGREGLDQVLTLFLTGISPRDKQPEVNPS